MPEDYLSPIDPNFRTLHKRIQNDERVYPHFKDHISVPGGTHIRVTLSPKEQVRYISKTIMVTQNMLVVCDFDMQSVYVFAGQPGAMHDTCIVPCIRSRCIYIPTSSSKHIFSNIMDVIIPSTTMHAFTIIIIICNMYVGKYYVVDAGYLN
jgi:hypothetical protein